MAGWRSTCGFDGEGRYPRACGIVLGLAKGRGRGDGSGLVFIFGGGESTRTLAWAGPGRSARRREASYDAFDGQSSMHMCRASFLVSCLETKRKGLILGWFPRLASHGLWHDGEHLPNCRWFSTEDDRKSSICCHSSTLTNPRTVPDAPPTPFCIHSVLPNIHGCTRDPLPCPLMRWMRWLARCHSLASPCIHRLHLVPPRPWIGSFWALRSGWERHSLPINPSVHPWLYPGIQLGDPSKLTWTCSGKRSRPSRHNHARAARSSASSRRRRAQVKDVRWRYDRQTTDGKGRKGSSAFPTLLGSRWRTPSRVGFFVDASHAPSRVRSALVEAPCNLVRATCDR